MPERQITELPAVTDLGPTSVMHCKQLSDNSDRQMTVQGILDLVPSDPVPPDNEEGILPASDQVMFADQSDSFTPKRVSFDAFRTALGVASVSGNILNGEYQVGDLQIRWGEVISTGNGEETHTFSVPFTAQCFSVVMQSREANAGKPINVTSFNQTGFTTDRDFLGSYDVDCNYIAIGR